MFTPCNTNVRRLIGEKGTRGGETQGSPPEVTTLSFSFRRHIHGTLSTMLSVYCIFLIVISALSAQRQFVRLSAFAEGDV